MIRFNFGAMIFIFCLSFIACFGLYMLAANVNANFFADEFDDTVLSEDEPPEDIPDVTDNETEEPTTEVQENITINNPVPQSDPVDASYLDDCCLITDQTLLQMGEFGKFQKQNIFCNSQLNAANCTTVKVESSFGTVAVYDIIKNKKPQILYIMLGCDLGTSTPDDMIANYTTLVNNLHGALPDMKIYIMQLPPVIYDTETKSNETVNDYNNRLLAMANTLGVYCIDTNTALKNESGALKEEYWSYETLALSEEAYNTVCGYILTHT